MKCSRCDTPATRTLCVEAFCHGCAETILEPIRERVFTNEGGEGCGVKAGRMRPDWGATFADLECNQCKATWVGPIGETCSWCVESLERQQVWQAELVLQPPDYHLDDQRREPACIAWAERLAVAVDAGLIDNRQAARAWDREVGRGAA